MHLYLYLSLLLTSIRFHWLIGCMIITGLDREVAKYCHTYTCNGIRFVKPKNDVLLNRRLYSIKSYIYSILYTYYTI